MSDIADKPFPSYLEMPSRLPAWFWWAFRLATIAVMVFVIWKVWAEPNLGFAIFWKLLIPSLPLLFAVAPGVWRQICPMAFMNQLPRTFGFSRELTLPVRVKNLAYFISVLAFFFLVSLRHIYFNHEPLAWMVLIFTALGLAFVGGFFFKGRSGWCGTFCPLAPIQKAYGHAPIITVKNGYCPSCVGCQKNCYDFNPRAAFLSDLSDKDLWYAGHKKFFVAGLPGFAIGFFTATDPAVTGLLAYFLHMATWIVTTLGIYMAARIFIRVSDHRIAAISALSALNIFYWFAAQGIVDTAFQLAGNTAPTGAAYVLQAVVMLVSIKIIANGLKAEKDFRALTDGASQPMVSVKVDAVRAGGANTVDDLVTDKASGRSFAANPDRSLLDGIESAGLAQDFGCRMGMCGADPIAIVDGMENLSPPSDDELATLRRLGLEGRARMACVCKATGGGVTIDLNMDPNDLPEPPPPANQVDLAEETGVQKVVIIGNGTSGMAVADEIRRLSPTCKIDVIARENHPFYNRMAIGRLLYGRTGLDDLNLLAPDWYTKKNITVWLNTQATDVDRLQKFVTLGTGESLPYDKLIMAQGASAAVPPADGIEMAGCFVLREAEDAQAIRAWRQEKNCTRAVVQGGGVLGVEAADALRRLNLDTTIIQRSERLMNRELDSRGSELLEHFLKTLGIHVMTGASVAAIKGTDRVEGVELTNGDVIPTDLFVTCAGIKANTELPKKIGLKVNRGIVVDAQMCTSDPDIFAIGDVAELPGTVGGLWAVGTAQAAVAAQAVFGQKATYTPPNTMVSLKMDGIDVKGFGDLDPADDGLDLSEPSDSRNQHRRLIIKGGKLKGAVFVGPPGIGKDLAHVIQTQADLTPIIERLREGDWKALGEA
tara:strand:+ start:572 stop:3214 length:2643 start_codon:yes stop_codon:yes gene_type:complete